MYNDAGHLCINRRKPKTCEQKAWFREISQAEPRLGDLSSSHIERNDSWTRRALSTSIHINTESGSQDFWLESIEL